MDTATNARIDEYLEVYERVDTVVNSAEVTAAIIEQVGKDTRCKWLMNCRSNGNGNGHSNSNGDEPATEKQLGFLKSLGVDVPAISQATRRDWSLNVTWWAKARAARLID
ncbi:MAG: hypothetical protein IH991_08200 [Planctomycetes bacterium]|nr:hypothetical protein [Planctomycetota bacterium]